MNEMDVYSKSFVLTALYDYFYLSIYIYIVEYRYIQHHDIEIYMLQTDFWRASCGFK